MVSRCRSQVNQTTIEVDSTRKNAVARVALRELGGAGAQTPPTSVLYHHRPSLNKDAILRKSDWPYFSSGPGQSNVVDIDGP